MWDLWFFGDQDTGIRPYRLISKVHDIQKMHYMRYTRAKSIIHFIGDIVTELNLLTDGTRLTNMSMAASDRVFSTAFDTAIARLYGEKSTRRAEQVSYGRLYNVLCGFRRRQAL